MPPPFMVENAYTVAPMTSPQLSQFPADNNFVYAHYTPQTPPTLPGSFKHYPEEYPSLRPTTTDAEAVHAIYQREHSQPHPAEQDTAPQIKYEPRVASQRSFSPTPPVASKIVHRNVAEDKANEIEFTTNVDILMKAIQLKDENQDDSEFTGAGAAYPSPPRVDEEKFNLRRKSCSPEETTHKGSQSGRDRQKRYVCDVKGCKKRCNQKTQLETHKRAHTGEKPYTFAQRGNVKPHRLTHFKVKPYPCNLDGCQKTFGQRGNLKNHHNTFHAETLRDLTIRFSNLTPGEKLSEEDQKLFHFFAELYKNSNKGIKGRGKERRDASKHRSSSTPTVAHHYSAQPPLVQQHHMYPHPRLPTQHGLPCPEDLGNYGMSRNGPQHIPYGMYDMDQASATSSDTTATASSSPVTIYEEDHGRTMLPQHRIY
ncbi:mitochondrial FAD carrier protein flx1 [Hypoxylon texense]